MDMSCVDETTLDGTLYFCEDLREMGGGEGRRGGGWWFGRRGDRLTS